MKQQERQERSRREIFQAAMEEFGAHGYDKVSMENLCTRHGISKGMMYHYYSNKDELFLLCVQDVFQNLKEQIEQEIVQLEQQSPLRRSGNSFCSGNAIFSRTRSANGSLRRRCSTRPGT